MNLFSAFLQKGVEAEPDTPIFYSSLRYSSARRQKPNQTKQKKSAGEKYIWNSVSYIYLPIPQST